LIFVFILFFNWVNSQEYVIEITLVDAVIVEECHFGDEWNAYFSFGGKYLYQKSGDKFVLKPNQSCPIHSIIYEGNETYNDYEKTTSMIRHEKLHVGIFESEEYLYIEDKNTGRYHCNNATFKFS